MDLHFTSILKSMGQTGQSSKVARCSSTVRYVCGISACMLFRGPVFRDSTSQRHRYFQLLKYGKAETPPLTEITHMWLDIDKYGQSLK